MLLWRHIRVSPGPLDPAWAVGGQWLYLQTILYWSIVLKSCSPDVRDTLKRVKKESAQEQSKAVTFVCSFLSSLLLVTSGDNYIRYIALLAVLTQSLVYASPIIFVPSLDTSDARRVKNHDTQQHSLCTCSLHT